MDRKLKIAHETASCARSHNNMLKYLERFLNSYKVQYPYELLALETLPTLRGTRTGPTKHIVHPDEWPVPSLGRDADGGSMVTCYGCLLLRSFLPEQRTNSSCSDSESRRIRDYARSRRAETMPVETNGDEYE
ncbi:unnamed protein product [Heligmosomoides polygyrus]|uniref:DUF4187 domain-containing protein n=1 Tax=Heligmosomoides polygyrus TaxID=6339 RepID=A0A183FBB5_HELPZ|nr:unnamed protein product [Heligmosomoides polygyrus]